MSKTKDSHESTEKSMTRVGKKWVVLYQVESPGQSLQEKGSGIKTGRIDPHVRGTIDGHGIQTFLVRQRKNVTQQRRECVSIKSFTPLGLISPRLCLLSPTLPFHRSLFLLSYKEVSRTTLHSEAMNFTSSSLTCQCITTTLFS